MNKKFISWRRVSTLKQGRTGLGLEAQMDIIKHFVSAEGGELIADYCEVYTGTKLSGCTELRKAMDRCKKEGAILIIAKSDRFRNTMEALRIYEEMGDGNIYFCDLPRSDKFSITLFFALAEREALLVSLRTKAALKAKKDRGEATGGSSELWGKKTGADRSEVIKRAQRAALANRRTDAQDNPENRAFKDFIEYWEAVHGPIGKDTDWEALSDALNSRGRKTATGLPFNSNRARSMYKKISKLYS